MFKKWMDRSPSNQKCPMTKTSGNLSKKPSRAVKGAQNSAIKANQHNEMVDNESMISLTSYISHMGGDVNKLQGWRALGKKNHRTGSMSSEVTYVSIDGTCFYSKFDVANHFNLVSVPVKKVKKSSSSSLTLHNIPTGSFPASNQTQNEHSDDSDNENDGFESIDDSTQKEFGGGYSSPSTWRNVAPVVSIISQDDSQQHVRSATFNHQLEKDNISHHEERGNTAVDLMTVIDPSPLIPSMGVLVLSPKSSKRSYSPLLTFTPTRQSNTSSLVDLKETPPTPPTPLHIVVPLLAQGQETSLMSRKGSLPTTVDIMLDDSESDEDDDAFEAFEMCEEEEGCNNPGSPSMRSFFASSSHNASVNNSRNFHEDYEDDESNMFEVCPSSPTASEFQSIPPPPGPDAEKKCTKKKRKRPQPSSKSKTSSLLSNKQPGDDVKTSGITRELVAKDAVPANMMVVSKEERMKINSQRLKKSTSTLVRKQKTVKINQSELIEKISWLQEKVLPALVDIISLESIVDEHHTKTSSATATTQPSFSSIETSQRLSTIPTSTKKRNKKAKCIKDLVIANEDVPSELVHEKEEKQVQTRTTRKNSGYMSDDIHCNMTSEQAGLNYDNKVFEAVSKMEKILMAVPFSRMPDVWFKNTIADVRKSIFSRDTSKLQEIASSLSDHCMAVSMSLFGEY